MPAIDHEGLEVAAWLNARGIPPDEPPLFDVCATKDRIAAPGAAPLCEA